MERQRAEDALRHGEVLGVELNTEYRVLAVTIGPAMGGGGEWPIDADDPRLQLLLFPVGEFAAALRRTSDAGIEVLQFSEEQLPQIVALFDHATPLVDPWPDTRPNRGEWGPRLSLQGNSPAPDGRSRHVWLALEEDDLRLDLHATFDDMRARDASGSDLW